MMTKVKILSLSKRKNIYTRMLIIMYIVQPFCFTGNEIGRAHVLITREMADGPTVITIALTVYNTSAKIIQLNE